MDNPRKGDLTDPRAIYAKGGLFLLLGVLAGAMLLAERFTWHGVVLLVICVWGFCRAYYFAFYVIEHYVDSNYHFSGLIDFSKYWFRRRAEKMREIGCEDSPPTRSSSDVSIKKAVDR